ncbi:hypothetical protein RHMOL_Rhmol02G0238800 [Rhododendron molle]|uniref:Uncharacterized protein n=1 Tax=Rhododendron molle TaxID=49168 RepID=A0ACC0PT49_RHOML|nr:hypothetical protein RHMOL_Rhmol02G0238800 [Rhododendron molle]
MGGTRPVTGARSVEMREPRHRNGAFVLGTSISDLCHQSIPAVQLNSASSLDSPYFNVTDPNPSPSLTDRFQSNVSPPAIDMQAVGWAMVDNMDFATVIINEWSGLELDGFHNSLNISHSIKPGMMPGWLAEKRPCSIHWMASPYTCFFSSLNPWSPKKSTTGTLSRSGKIPWIRS